MTGGVTLQKLGEICTLINGRAYSKNELLAQGKYPVLRVGNFFTSKSWYYSDLELSPDKYCDTGDLLYAWSASFGPRIWEGERAIFHYHIWKVIPDPAKVDKRFLYYFFMWDTEQIKKDQGAGTTMIHVAKGSMEERMVPVPPLAAQHRIVAIVDEAFEFISTVKANTERNLRNVQELYACYLKRVFDGNDETCTQRRLAEVAKEFGRGKSRHRPRNEPKLYGGPYPFIQTGDISNADHWLDKFTQTYSEHGLAQSRLWPAGTVCIAIVGATVGETAILGFDACFPDSVIGIVADPDVSDPEYIEYMLQSFKALLKEKGQGTARDNINLGTFENQLFPFPSLNRQREIVLTANELRDQLRRLEDIFRRKLAALEDLKNSLLQQAFSGQLFTASQTATPQFTAKVIALAYVRHARQQREKTFGRVKEQKVLHLVEAIAKVDLGRHPMKDAAGPNDFQHMLKAEQWAKENSFFEMIDRGQGYDFKPLKDFDKCLLNARQELGPHLNRIEEVIDLLVPMDSQDAEVFATVHAAWNNLLMDGVEATESAILKEARDTWHPDKLSIPEHKFKKAIELVRRKNLIPDGTGKYVNGQRALL